MQQGRSERQSFTRYHASYGSTPSSRYSRSVALYHACPQRERVVDKLPRIDRFAGHRVFATRRSAEAPHRSPVRLMALAAIVVATNGEQAKFLISTRSIQSGRMALMPVRPAPNRGVVRRASR